MLFWGANEMSVLLRSARDFVNDKISLRVLPDWVRLISGVCLLLRVQWVAVHDWVVIRLYYIEMMTPVGRVWSSWDSEREVDRFWQ